MVRGVWGGAFWGHFLTNLSEQMALRGPSWRQDGRIVAPKCAKYSLKAILGRKLFRWGGCGVDVGSARLAGGGVRGGIVNYLQIFKEDICRYLKKISADSSKSAGICWKSICKGVCREGYLHKNVKGPANPPKTLECPRAPCGSCLGPEQ